MAYKWNILLKAKNIHINLYEAAKVYYISNCIGLILPSTIGADLMRVHLIAKKKYFAADALSSILVERFLGLLALFVYVLFSIPLLLEIFHSSHIDMNNLSLLIVIISLICLLCFIFTFNKKVIDLTLGLMKRLESKKLLSKLMFKIQKLIISYQDYKTKKIILLFFFILTLFEIFTGICINYLIALSFHVEISIIYFVALVPIMMLLVRIPFSLNGFGINEGGFAYFLVFVGVQKTIGFSIGLIDHIINIIGVLPGALFYFLQKDNKKVKKSELEISD